MLRPKPFIEKLKPPLHGSTGFMTLSTQSEKQILDFSTCCNPYKPPRQVILAATAADINKYPDPESRQLVKKLAANLNLAEENIIIGSGSTELLRLAAAAYLGPESPVIIPSPTYAEYEMTCQLINAPVIHFGTLEENNFRLDANTFISFARPLQPAGIFICNPNNPTGQYLKREEIEGIIRSFPSALIILDEAYLAFTAEAWSSLDLIESGNVLIVRSLTKDYALAGLRLGYAVSSPEIISILKKVRPPWNVNSPAQNAGLASLECSNYLSDSCRRIERNKIYLTDALSALGYKIIPTQTNFFLVKTGDAATTQRKLLRKHILVRDCTSFGLHDYIRLAPRNQADCRRLVKVFKELAEDKA